MTCELPDSAVNPDGTSSTTARATRTYLYALIRPADADVSAVGLEDAPVRTVVAGDIGAVVSTVARDAFDPATVQARSNDLHWLETVARLHDAVISAAAEVATTIPLRLGTTSADDPSVVELLRDLNAAAHRSFDRLAHRVEYGVQVFAAPSRSPAASGDRSEAGAAFLRRRRAELQQEEARRAEESAHLDAAFETLAALASESRRNPLRAASTHEAGAMQLNGTFLVDTAAADSFRSAVDSLAEGFGADRVVVTGPWAPYSFAELEL